MQILNKLLLETITIQKFNDTEITLLNIHSSSKIVRKITKINASLMNGTSDHYSWLIEI